jgi:hypothetical protein
MGLIGIRIRIAIKEKFSPEFKLNADNKTEPEASSTEKKISTESEQKASTESEQKASTESEQKASTESEQIKLDEAKIKKIDTLEEEEESLK